MNLNRRHLTHGQRAMAVAMIYPEPSKGGRGGNKGLRGATDVEKSRLSRARTVLRHSPRPRRWPERLRHLVQVKGSRWYDHVRRGHVALKRESPFWIEADTGAAKKLRRLAVSTIASM
jgi:hypothetical protein